MNLLKFIGNFFIYKSPLPGQGFINYLPTLTNAKLKILSGTKINYPKKKLIKLYLSKNQQKSLHTHAKTKNFHDMS
mgnify:CR=1 FL=1